VQEPVCPGGPLARDARGIDACCDRTRHGLNSSDTEQHGSQQTFPHVLLLGEGARATIPEATGVVSAYTYAVSCVDQGQAAERRRRPE
jgi:hypothetical protein